MSQTYIDTIQTKMLNSKKFEDKLSKNLLCKCILLLPFAYIQMNTGKTFIFYKFQKPAKQGMSHTCTQINPPKNPDA